MTDTANALNALHVALTNGDRAAMNAILGDLIDRRAALGQRWRLFADVLLTNGETDLAVRAIDLYDAGQALGMDQLFSRAVVYARAGRGPEAAKIVEAMRARESGNPQLNHFAGALASEQGDFELASRRFEAVLARAPVAGQTWLELSAIHRFTAADPLLDRLRQAIGSVDRLAPDSATPLLYALGKALDDIGDVDGAFAAFDRGASLVPTAADYDAAADRASADAIRANWTGDALAAVSRTASGSPDRAIVVTGLPRSGTTLVEQILASHRDVVGGGEFALFNAAASLIGGLMPVNIEASRRAGRSLDDAANLYHDLTAKRFGATGRVVDKTLDLSRQLGLIAAALPDVPLFWVRRDPLDTAWSCFRTHFAGRIDWSWRQETIAQHFRLEDQLFAHWQAVLGDRLIAVPYEELVRDPAGWTPRLEAGAGLDHDPATLAPHLTPRAVLTSSVFQVRQPIGTGAIGAGQRYRRHLQPFIDAYGYEG